MLYVAKKDTWIICMLCTLTLSMLVCGVACFAMAHPVTLFYGLFLVGTGAIPLWCLCDTSYEISATQLIVRCGPFRRHVPLEDINHVQPSSSIRYVFFGGIRGFRLTLSSDALLIKHSRANHSPWMLVICPDDKPAFLADLAHATSVDYYEDGSLGLALQ